MIYVILTKGFLPSHANNSITSDHSTFGNDLNNITNVSIPTQLDGITDGGHSPNRNTMISSQILGSTPLSQIGCQLPIDHYASELKSVYFFFFFFGLFSSKKLLFKMNRFDEMKLLDK